MKFSEIKSKIKNLGNIKSLSEIKKANLRICRNIKSETYWLIEKEFLKPVIIDYEKQISNFIKAVNFVFCFPEIDYKKSNYYANKYIEWGSNLETKGKQKQEAGIALPKISSLIGRKYWYSFTLPLIESDLFWQKRTGERFALFFTQAKSFADQKFYPLINYKSKKNKILLSLNSIIERLIFETLSMSYTGAFTLIEISVEDVEKLSCIDPNLIPDIDIDLNKNFQSLFKDLNINPLKRIRDQKPEPTESQKVIDDIAFEILGLDKNERQEVYWAVSELVKNRLEKAKNV